MSRNSSANLVRSRRHLQAGAGYAQNTRFPDVAPLQLLASSSRVLRLIFLDGQEQLELWGKLLLRVETVGKVDAANTAVSMDLYTKRLNVVRSVRTPCEVRQVELDLVPAFVQTHGHRANEGLHSCRRLIVGSAEPTTNVLIVQNLDFEGEILLQVLDDHHQERQLDSQGGLRLRRAGDICG